MSEEVIDRVDQMIRKNNIKYKDQQSQKAYQQALKQYEKQSKAQLAKQYAQLVKQGNRKAVQKAKAAKKSHKKQTKKAKPIPKQPQQQKTVMQAPKKRMSQAQVMMATKTIQARAQRIFQQQQLQKLSRKLEEQKKRTKLYELNQKCKKMLSKSHQRIIPAKNISQDKMKILKKMEEKALGQINDLDHIINGLIDKANQKVENKAELSHCKQNNLSQSSSQKQEMLEDDIQFEAEDGAQQDYLDINTIIFQKSSEELLKMDYIPL